MERSSVDRQSAEEHRARVCGRFSTREESALRLKNLFAAPFFPPPLSLSLFVFRFLVVYSFPSASEDHLPQFQSCHRGEPFFAGR